MHPNLRQVEKALLDSGHTCMFVVSHIGPSEIDDSARRLVVKPHAVSAGAINLLMEKIRPDVLIQRNFDAQFVDFWRIAGAKGITRLRYSQDPQHVPFQEFFVRPLRVVRLSADFLRFQVILGRHWVVTPVKHWGATPGRRVLKRVQYLPFPAGAPKPLARQSPQIPTVICVAKHGQQRKRVNWLLRALAKADHDFRIFLVGSGPPSNHQTMQKHHAAIKRRVKKLGERANLVRFYYNLGEEEINALYSSSDLFVLPSKREPMAISPLEAMSHGLPVLVASDGGAAAYVREVGESQVFRARSFRHFRSQLNALLTDEDLRERLSCGALRAVKTTHAPTAFVEGLKYGIQQAAGLQSRPQKPGKGVLPLG